MLTYKHRYYDKAFMSFNCRICKISLANPEELRIHSMEKHKGHMIRSIRN